MKKRRHSPASGLTYVHMIHTGKQLVEAGPYGAGLFRPLCDGVEPAVPDPKLES